MSPARSITLFMWIALSLVWSMIGAILLVGAIFGLVMEVGGWTLITPDVPPETPESFEWSVLLFLGLALAWTCAGLFSLFTALRLQVRWGKLPN